MPTYDYECSNCGVFEASQRISENAYTQCPKCGGAQIKRLLSAPAFHLKGSGWYKTDYAKNGSSPAPSSKSATSSETKPAETPKESCSGSCACASSSTDTPKKD